MDASKEALYAQIAEQLGYSSTCHFIRQFKQCAGDTPGQWGKQ